MSKKKAENKEKKFTAKADKFCQEYMIDLNGTQAAIRAGYSEKTARQIATTLLSKVYIQKRISELKAEIAEKAQITAVEILQELKNFAFSDITETIMLSTEEIKTLPPEVRRLITQYKKITKTEIGEGKDPQAYIETMVELKFVDKMRAFEMLNRHTGFYEKDNQQLTPKLNKITQIEIVRPKDEA